MANQELSDKFYKGALIQNPYGLKGLILDSKIDDEGRVEILVLWLVDRSLQTCFPNWGSDGEGWELVKPTLFQRVAFPFLSWWGRRKAKRSWPWIKI